MTQTKWRVEVADTYNNRWNAPVNLQSLYISFLPHREVNHSNTMSEHKEVKYEGWGAFDKTSIQGNFKWFEYEPKTFCEDDIECE